MQQSSSRGVVRNHSTGAVYQGVIGHVLILGQRWRMKRASRSTRKAWLRSQKITRRDRRPARARAMARKFCVVTIESSSRMNRGRVSRAPRRLSR